MSGNQGAPSAVPRMSVVLAAPDGLNAVRKTLRALDAQTVRDRLEVVLVAVDVEPLGGARGEFTGFASLKLVPATSGRTLGEIRAAGVGACTSELVMFAEDHCFPNPQWAEVLIDEWGGASWAVIAPAIGNANPDSAVSWANLFSAYGRWVAPSWSGERAALPGHNCGYRRELLLAQADRLPMLLDDEWEFMAELREVGHRFYLTAKTRTEHQNISHLGSALRLRYQGGRLSASSRAESWSTMKRWSHALATPLIPVVRFRDVWAQIRASGVEGSTVRRMLPALGLLLLVAGFGEGVGYAFGAGDSPTKKAALEHDRHRHLNLRDREVEARELEAMVREVSAMAREVD